MMVKRWSAHFSLSASVILLATSCGSASKSGDRLPSMDTHAEISSQEAMDGSIVLVSIRLPVNVSAPVVNGEFDGIALPFFKNGDVYQSVVGIPYDREPGAATVKVVIGEGATSASMEVPFKIVKGDYLSETLKVDGRRVQPQSPKDLARIKKEVAEIGILYSTITPKKYWDGPFVLPINSPFTSRYGTRRVYNGVQKSAHLGLDLKAAIGTPIHAPAAGKVVMAKNLFFTGYTVMLDHGYGVITLYAHMSKLRVKKGAEVKTGDLLGLSGMTGRVTGPHLHWQAVIHKQKVNPLDLTRAMK